MRHALRRSALLALLLVGSVWSHDVRGQTGNSFVPGTGVQLTQVGDDFEDADWKWIPNNPKSTEDINERQNQPIGKSSNGRWYEGIKRGHPDIVRRVPPPPGGLPGSQGALLLQSLYTGIPNRPSYQMHQEDFICNVQYRLGGAISASQEPSVTARIYLPPIEEWERRSGPHFAFRVALETTKTERKQRFLFSTTSTENEVYWPGLFILMDTKEKTAYEIMPSLVGSEMCIRDRPWAFPSAAMGQCTTMRGPASNR